MFDLAVARRQNKWSSAVGFLLCGEKAEKVGRVEIDIYIQIHTNPIHQASKCMQSPT